jgi:tetratricopeptide (TPR) repeat protein
MRSRALVLIFFFTLFFSLPAFSQISGQAERPWWYLLEEGKSLFRSGRYGDALIMFEDARRIRHSQFTRLEQNLVFFLSTPDARRLGDSLERIETYIASHHETAAAAALAELYYRVPKESLDDSAKRALEELDRLKAYPEAEYWIGETYRAEGELSLAFRQYELAWEQRALLEAPDSAAGILYKITDIHRVRREYQEMEKRANEIIEGDELWAGSSGSRVRAAMSRILENEGVNRFLTLYRHKNTVTEKAHRLMGFFCYASSRHSRAAEHLMFAFLIQNTVLIDEIIRRQFDFTFTSLENLMSFVRSRPELAAFLEETEYYRTVYYLASALYAEGKTRPSAQLWAFLAASEDAGEWGARARLNRSPVIDRAVEMP